MKIVVCIKQVPDTKGGVKFNPDGTLDRSAMMAIMNPDDKAGLEAALRLKDQYGAEVTVLTMGLPKAEEVLREALAMGADKGILVTDRVLGGADTWATSQTIAGALRNLEYDLIITGRQAIDGDTAQVGPQIAEKLGLPQITYAEEILDITPENITVKRRLENGVETLRSPLPCVVTVNGSAAECRPRNAMRLQKYKYAASTSEKAKLSEDRQALLEKREYLNIPEWSAAYVEADPEQIGLPGSPTKVKAIENVVFTAKESRCIENNDQQIEDLIRELIANHTIG